MKVLPNPPEFGAAYRLEVTSSCCLAYTGLVGMGFERMIVGNDVDLGQRVSVVSSARENVG